jgi:hypothetical protein
MNNKRIKHLQSVAHDEAVRLQSAADNGKIILNLASAVGICKLIEELCKCLAEPG